LVRRDEEIKLLLSAGCYADFTFPDRPLAADVTTL
jgi:hypothetical protein